jgi:hypothetical protein
MNRKSYNAFKWLNLIIVLLSLSLTVTASWSQRQKITSTPRGVGAQFGNAVTISGSTMVVGARFDSTTASQAGAAYVYVLNAGSWAQQAVLLAPDGAASDKFGYSVAISENTIVVGAYNDDSPLSNAGSAYVFVRSGTTWSFQQKLTASDAVADDQFGVSVAVSGPTAFVGANFSDLPSNSDAGAVYRFTQSGTVWSQVQKLSPAGGVILGDHFGESLAVSGISWRSDRPVLTFRLLLLDRSMFLSTLAGAFLLNKTRSRSRAERMATALDSRSRSKATRSSAVQHNTPDHRAAGVRRGLRVRIQRLELGFARKTYRVGWRIG